MAQRHINQSQLLDLWLKDEEMTSAKAGDLSRGARGVRRARSGRRSYSDDAQSHRALDQGFPAYLYTSGRTHGRALYIGTSASHSHTDKEQGVNVRKVQLPRSCVTQPAPISD